MCDSFQVRVSIGPSVSFHLEEKTLAKCIKRCRSENIIRANVMAKVIKIGILTEPSRIAVRGVS